LLLKINSLLYNHDGLHQLALAALSSYDTAPAPVFKGLPSLLVALHTPLVFQLNTPKIIIMMISLPVNRFLPVGPVDASVTTNLNFELNTHKVTKHSTHTPTLSTHFKLEGRGKNENILQKIIVSLSLFLTFPHHLLSGQEFLPKWCTAELGRLPDRHGAWP
jgi:hypothetical protein